MTLWCRGNTRQIKSNINGNNVVRNGKKYYNNIFRYNFVFFFYFTTLKRVLCDLSSYCTLEFDLDMRFIYT